MTLSVNLKNLVASGRVFLLVVGLPFTRHSLALVTPLEVLRGRLLISRFTACEQVIECAFSSAFLTHPSVQASLSFNFCYHAILFAKTFMPGLSKIPRYMVQLPWPQQLNCPTFPFVGGAVASWLVRSSPDRAVWVRALAGDIVLCSWARHFTLTVPLSTQVCKWVPANLKLGVTLRWTSIPSRGE